MKYMLLIYDDEQNWARMSEAERGQMFADYGQLLQQTKASGHYVSSGRLQPIAAATSVRVREGKRLLTDGPFAETREQLGGYYLIEATDLDDALSVAARIPSARSGTIDVRPLMEIPVAAAATR